ncbi:hypothetical protein ACU4GA_18280 [Methylobacterium oryzae CBMB20]
MSHTPTGSPDETGRAADAAPGRGAGRLDDAGVAKQKLVEAIESSSEGFALF